MDLLLLWEHAQVTLKTVLVYARCAGEVGRLAEVQLEDGSSLHARLVVGADGPRSRCGLGRIIRV